MREKLRGAAATVAGLVLAALAGAGCEKVGPSPTSGQAPPVITTKSGVEMVLGSADPHGRYVLWNATPQPPNW